MRVLFTFAGNSGHFQPLVPIARAAEGAGHTVAVTGRPLMVPKIEAAGFSGYPTGGDDGGEPVRLPLRPLDQAGEDRDFREGFARRMAAERAGDVLALARRWRPDVLVCEDADYGALIAAELLGLPYATVLAAAAGQYLPTAELVEPLGDVRARYGLPPDPGLAMLSRYLVLSPAPLSFRDPEFPVPPTLHAMRPAALEPPNPADVAAAPDWLRELDGTVPVVYVTLGTVYNTESGDLFARIVTGLRELPVRLVVTVGEHIDPAELGPQPGNVHIARYVPQALVLPRASAVVSHAGSGTVLGALAYGLPLVLLPLGADQLRNARRCEQLGVGRVLEAYRSTPRSIRDAVATVLAEPGYRHAARTVRDEIARLPGPEHAARLITGLVR